MFQLSIRLIYISFLIPSLSNSFSVNNPAAASISTTATTETRIEGPNYLLIKSAQERRRQKNNAAADGDIDDDDLDSLQHLPPLVIIPGMAQSIAAYEHHLPSLLSQSQQDVLLYQPIGLGRTTTNSDFQNVSLPAQAEHLMAIVDNVLFDDDDNDTVATTTTTKTITAKINVAGFSLGGRIALCCACMFPHRISKLHLTGVALQPSEHALIHYHAWKQMLNVKNMEGFAWSALLGTYSPTFLQQQQQQQQPSTSTKLNSWIQALCRTHTPEGLLALLEQTTPGQYIDKDDDDHDENDVDQWSVSAMVKRVASRRREKEEQGRSDNDNFPPVAFCVGQYDRIATVESVNELAKQLLGGIVDVGDYDLPKDNANRDDKGPHHHSAVSILEGCGHAVPMEAPRLWRQDIVKFMNE